MRLPIAAHYKFRDWLWLVGTWCNVTVGLDLYKGYSWGIYKLEQCFVEIENIPIEYLLDMRSKLTCARFSKYLSNSVASCLPLAY